jgi:Family of unknown function (DUF6662)
VPIKLRRNLARWTLASTAIISVTAFTARADEQLFGFTRGAETLPQGRSELYQFMTLRTGKAEGSYYGSDFETEVEHGFTDKFQASLSLENRCINNHGVNGDRDALDDKDNYRFGGVTAAAKYRVLSTFEDPVGLAFRVESGYLFNDEVDDFVIKPHIAIYTIRGHANCIGDFWLWKNSR